MKIPLKKYGMEEIIHACFSKVINTPRNLEQYKTWIGLWLPGGASVHTLGFAAICWAIWKYRNKACFHKKLIKSPAEIVINACALMDF